MSIDRAVRRARRLLGAGVFLCAFWALLTEGDPASWVIGGPAIVMALAAVASLPPRAAPTPRLLPLAGLIGFFVVETVRGAVDVGGRALAREPLLHTGTARWRTRLHSRVARLTLAHGISLIPGTLTARLEDDELEIHLLDDRTPWRDGVAALEARVVAVFEPERRPDA